MVTITFHCPHCQSEALVRNDRAQGGKQKYLCQNPHLPAQLLYVVLLESPC
jgi:transposase-like protein